jgi:hypothetical protein
MPTIEQSTTVEDVVEHVRSMARKWAFKVDASTARDAVCDSASALEAQLTDAEIEQACDQLLED